MTDLSPRDLCHPAVVLAGTVDHAMYETFRMQMDKAPTPGLVVVELGTLGGDPEVARMMGEDVRFRSEAEPERRFVFLGKAAVYSAGVTFMSFFERDNRYLSRGTRLMIHERQMSEILRIEGSLTTCGAGLKAKLHELEHSILIQNEGFEALIKGSKIELDEVIRRAIDNWYVEAHEAVDLGLVRAVI